MPDGQLCLLALPPECCQGDGPEAMQYLKLFCRYITDRKVGVTGTYVGPWFSTPVGVCGRPSTSSLSLSLLGCGLRDPAGDF